MHSIALLVASHGYILGAHMNKHAFLNNIKGKDAIIVAKVHDYSQFFMAGHGSNNIQLGTTTYGHGGLIVFIKKYVCTSSIHAHGHTDVD